MSQPTNPPDMASASSGSRSSSPFNQFGDTSLTKIFVGGLAWETQHDTVRRYFEQFGEILEAVVITDKTTGRSKGYGFVTFRDPEGARRACADPTPVIDGRRTNCNLASLGIRSRASTLQHGARFRAGSPYTGGSPRRLQIYSGPGSYSQPLPYAYQQQAFPYAVYGYPPYHQEYPYPPNVYNPYMAPQFPSLYGAPGTLGLYPYPFSQVQSPGLHSPQHQAGSQLVPYTNAGVSTVTSLSSYGGAVPMPMPMRSTGLTSGQISPNALAVSGPSPPQFALPGSTQQQFPGGAGGGAQQSSG